MRIVISLFGVAAIVAVGGVLVLAQRIEAEDLRRELIREAEAITGREVAVEGRVDLNLLPRPTLSLAGASLGDLEAPGGAVRLTVDRVDLQVRPLPLLRGDVQITGVRLVRPVLHVTDGPDLTGLPPLNAERPLLPLAALGVSRLSVIDGRASFGAGPEADAPTLERINLELEAEDRRGPFVLTGDFHASEHGFRMHARLGRLTADPSTTLQLELAAIEPGEDAARLTYRGLVLTDQELRLRGRIALAGESLRAGTQSVAALLGRAPPELPGWLGQPYELNGTIATMAGRAELGELLVTIAGAEAQGRMTMLIAPTPVVDVTLSLGRLDLAAPAAADWAAVALADQAAAWLDGTIDVTVGLLGYRGETVRRVRLTLGLSGEGELDIEQARAILPGNADVTFAGGVDRTNGGLALQGSLTGVTDDLGALLRWLDLDPAGVALEHLRTLSLSAEVGLSPEILRLQETEVRLDGSSITGSLAVNLEGRRQVAAALAIDRLDLDAYWPDATPADALGLVRGWLAHGDAAIEAEIDRLTWQGLRWDEVGIAGRAVDQRVSLEELAARGIAETDVDVSGEVDFAAEELDLAARVTAARPALLLRRLGLQPPIALARIGPVRLSGTAHGWRAGTRVGLDVEADEMTLALAGDLAWPEGAPAAYQLELEAGHPDYGALVQSLGATWRPEEMTPGPFELAGRLRGEGTDQVALVGSAGLGATRITGEVTWRDEAPRPQLGARLSLGEPRLDTLMPVLTLAGLRMDPAVLAGPVLGNWPTQPVEVGWLRAFDATVELTGKGGFAGERLEMNAGLSDGLVTLQHLAAELIGGRLQAEGSADLRRRLPYIALALSLQDIEAQKLVGSLGIPPVLEGTASLTADVTAIGRNAYDLMRTLTGALEVQVRDGRIHGLEIDGAGPAARVSPGISVEPTGIALDLNAADQEATDFAALDGRFTIRRGIAEASEVTLRLDERTARIEGLIDLLLWVADLTLVVGAGPAAEPALKLVGPLGDPQVVRLDAERTGEPEGSEPDSP